MGYIWGTILFVMGYIVGVHNFPSEKGGFVGKTIETNFFYAEQHSIGLSLLLEIIFNVHFFTKERFHS
jgi:hypothetical protein